MSLLTVDELRARTLSRQFPTIEGRGPESVLQLLRRLGPIQSQVPRAPFLAIGSRLPGVTYDTVVQLFESHRLLKASNLRGTVHTSGREHFGNLDTVARPGRAAALRNGLKLARLSAEEMMAEVEAYAAEDWRPRAEIVEHVRGWLAEHESPATAAAVGSSLPDAMVWGHSALIRRPRDGRWDRRTDTEHRLARTAVPDLAAGVDYPTALAELVRIHLGAYGPVTRNDLAFFFGAGLGAVDQAVTRLGEEVVRRSGPDRHDYLDLADAPPPMPVDLGVRLLPEFDGLLLGFHGPARTRFLEASQLPRIWAKVNGLFSPIVLSGDRIVASWKTLARGSRTDIEVTMLDPHPTLADDRFDDAVRATEQALGLSVTDLRVQRG